MAPEGLRRWPDRGGRVVTDRPVKRRKNKRKDPLQPAVPLPVKARGIGKEERQKTVDVKALASLHGGRDRASRRPSLGDLTAGNREAERNLETAFSILISRAEELAKSTS
jgi:hypothetical protein